MASSQSYKLMHFYYSMDEWELYDLSSDPNEMNNIYADAPDSLVSRLKSELENCRLNSATTNLWRK